MKIACILETDFEDSEYTQPAEAFSQAGHQVTVIGLQAGKELKGKKEATPVTVEKAFADVRPEQFDALFIPGGSSPDKLRAHPEPVQFTKAFFDAGKPVFAICHGPQLFLSAGTFRDHKMTAWKTVQVDLKLAGTNVVDQEVVVDRNLVTSRQPSDLPAFNQAALEMLKQPAASR
jgi:protease I